MCISFPTPPDNRLAGTPPGPVKLFLAGVVFLLVLLFAGLARLWLAGSD